MADNNFFLNYVLGAMLKKIVIPGTYHEQVKAVKLMQKDDVSGLVDSLTDFEIQSASVEYLIETKNETLTKYFKKWLDLINKDYNGIPTGINPLAEEYFKERWKYSSFPILKLAEWSDIGDNFIVPTKMFFVDGESVQAETKGDVEEIRLINYDYFIGNPHDGRRITNSKYIMTKPYGTWYDKYPTPYLIKRGIYHNWKLVQSLKDMQGQIVEQVIPYMLKITKGSENLAIQKDIGYSDAQLQGVIDEFKTLVSDYKEFTDKNQSMIRASNFDEKLEHMIPDLSTIFDPKLFEQAERNILSGLGFVDIAEAVSSSRRESILNPKGFIQETKKGVKDFKQLMKELVLKVMEKNATQHRKLANVDTRIISTPITGFMTDDFKDKMRQLYGKGLLSKQTAVELIGEVDFETEIQRREAEEKRGLTLSMYPPIEDNREGVGIDLINDEVKTDQTNNTDKKVTKTTDVNDKEIPNDKVDPQERKTFDVGAVDDPPSTSKDMPPAVKENLDIDLQKVFLRVYNRAFQTYENDTLSMRVAWSAIKIVARKNKKGLWVRKNKIDNGKKKKVILTKAMLENILDEEEKEAIDETLAMRQIENQEGKKGLIQKLINKKK